MKKKLFNHKKGMLFLDQIELFVLIVSMGIVLLLFIFLSAYMGDSQNKLIYGNRIEHIVLQDLNTFLQMPLLDQIKIIDRDILRSSSNINKKLTVLDLINLYFDEKDTQQKTIILNVLKEEANNFFNEKNTVKPLYLSLSLKSPNNLGYQMILSNKNIYDAAEYRQKFEFGIYGNEGISHLKNCPLVLEVPRFSPLEKENIFISYHHGFCINKVEDSLDNIDLSNLPEYNGQFADVDVSDLSNQNVERQP